MCCWIQSIYSKHETMLKRKIYSSTEGKGAGFRYSSGYFHLLSKYERTKKLNSSHFHASKRENTYLSNHRKTVWSSTTAFQNKMKGWKHWMWLLYCSSLSISPELISVIDMRIMKCHCIFKGIVHSKTIITFMLFFLLWKRYILCIQFWSFCHIKLSYGFFYDIFMILFRNFGACEP